MNEAYFNNHLEVAIEFAHQIHVLNENVIEPYDILAKIYEKRNKPLKLFYVKRASAEIKASDTKCWLECARLAKQVSYFQESLRCYNRALK